MKLAHKILSTVLVGAMSLTLLTACGMTQTQLEQYVKNYIKENGYVTREEAQSIAAQNSGSGGSSSAETSLSYSNSRLGAAAKQLSGSQWQIEYSGYGFGPEIYVLGSGVSSLTSYDGVKTVIAKNGTKEYIKVSLPNGETYAYMKDGEDCYVLERNVDDNLKLTKQDGVAVKISDSSTLAEFKNMFNSLETANKVFAPKSENVLSIKSGSITYKGKSYYSETARVLIDNQSTDVIYVFDGSTLKYVITSVTCTCTKYTASVDSSLFKLPATIMSEDEYLAAHSNTNM